MVKANEEEDSSAEARMWIRRFSLVATVSLLASCGSGESTQKNKNAGAPEASFNTQSEPVRREAAQNSETNTSEIGQKTLTGGQMNAVRSAQQYLSISGFSRKGLIEQLSSSAGDNYTVSQATYGARQAGAC